MLITARPGDPKVEEELRRLQYTPEERSRLFERTGPFPLDEWLAAGPPATDEQIQEMEDLLRLRDA